MPTGVYVRTKPNGMLGKHHRKESKRKTSEALKGIVRSRETKKKMSLAKKGIPSHRKGKHLTEEHKKRIAKGNKGKKLSLETRRKIGNAHRGEKSRFWKGGISFNHEYLEWLKHKNRRLKQASEGSHTFGEWELLKKQYGYTCPSCKMKEPKIKLTEDHIIPLSKGGSDYIENIQPLCGGCNSKKYTKTIKF